ncbi:hypothetical protein LZ30DRAFT_355404 [Colletotrichum cereale]|nr:hypothetical protein LZ30DRAFT_355404 [Colletotrichum cereale]
MCVLVVLVALEAIYHLKDILSYRHRHPVCTASIQTRVSTPFFPYRTLVSIDRNDKACCDAAPRYGRFLFQLTICQIPGWIKQYLLWSPSSSTRSQKLARRIASDLESLPLLLEGESTIEVHHSIAFETQTANRTLPRQRRAARESTAACDYTIQVSARPV